MRVTKRPAGDIEILVGYMRLVRRPAACIFFIDYRLLTCVFEFSKLLLFPRRASDPEVWVSKRGFPKAILTDECASDCIWTCLFHLFPLPLPSSTLPLLINEISMPSILLEQTFFGCWQRKKSIKSKNYLWSE